MNNNGSKIYKWAKQIFPYNRSITGEGTLKTLKFIKNKLKSLKIIKVKSGTKVYDWVVPDVWNIKNAYISDLKNNKIIDFKNNNLHVVGYSKPIKKIITFDELKKNLHTLKKLPKAIPYRTSYYKKDWGFCIEYEKFKKLKKQRYKILINSKFEKGHLNYGELLIKGSSKKEILLSTYICHPSMANNEVSGPVLLTALSQYILSLKNRYYSYRIIFIPETIGSIIYIKKNFKKLKKNVVAGYILTCVGDNFNFSYLESKNKNTLTDKVAKKIFEDNKIKYKNYSFLKRGSDERQFSSPGIDLPIGSIMRSKYGTYDYYHTSLDNMDFVSEKGFEGSYNIYKNVVDLLEINKIYNYKIICEPFLTKYKLRNTLGGIAKETNNNIINISNFLAYIDGRKDLIDLSELLEIDIQELNEIAKTLLKNKIIKVLT